MTGEAPDRSASAWDAGEVAPRVHLRLTLPQGARREPDAALAPFELGPLAGARVTLRAGFGGSFGASQLACAAAPARGFAPGVEELVLARATQIVRGAFPAVTRLDAGPSHATATGFDQRLEGTAALDGHPAPLFARHLLAFTETGESAVVCSFACVARDSKACADAVESATLEGALSPPPPPSLVVRALFAAVEQPAAALVIFAALALIATWILLARRPRSPSRFG